MFPLPGLIAAAGYDAAATALFARMTTQPSANRKQLISDLITEFKACGAWSVIEGCWMFAAHDEQASRLNWKSSAGTMVAVNATLPAFTVDRGHTITNANYMRSGTLYAINANDSGFQVARYRAGVTKTTANITGNGNQAIYANYAAGTMAISPKSNSLFGFTVPDVAGRFVGWSRIDGSNATLMFINNGETIAGDFANAVSNTAFGGPNAYVGTGNGNDFTARFYAFGSGKLTSIQLSAIAAAVTWHFSVLGLSI